MSYGTLITLGMYLESLSMEEADVVWDIVDRFEDHKLSRKDAIGKLRKLEMPKHVRDEII